MSALVTPGRAVGLDAFYTSATTADTVVQVAADGLGPPRSIADFSCGDGALLRAASAVWPRARYTGVDIDELALDRLRQCGSGWNLVHADFARYSEIAASQGETYDLVLLNPPFSYRGGRRSVVKVGEQTIEASPAMTFVIRAATLLAASGRLVAVLPRSSLSSERDREARDVLGQFGVLCRMVDLPRGAFSGANGRAVIARLDRGSRASPPSSSRASATENESVLLSRGVVPMHDALNRHPTYTLIHSVNLAGAQLRCLTSRSSSSRVLYGAVVLLPRVGTPAPAKIVAVRLSEPSVLSDCVIAVVMQSVAAARRLRSRIVQNWQEFEDLYSATCAPYITLARLAAFLSSIGYVVDGL